jgi:hypothetical protein
MNFKMVPVDFPISQHVPTTVKPRANAPASVGVSSWVKSKSGTYVQATGAAPDMHCGEPVLLVETVPLHEIVPDMAYAV